jgi:hypothetical protein
MEIEVRQRGGALGLDRRYLVRDGAIEVIDGGESRGRTRLDPAQQERIAELARAAVADSGPAAPGRRGGARPSDAMHTAIAIDGQHRLTLASGDDAPSAWNLVGEVSQASDW